jgi:hypothetical protein
MSLEGAPESAAAVDLILSIDQQRLLEAVAMDWEMAKADAIGVALTVALVYKKHVDEGHVIIALSGAGLQYDAAGGSQVDVRLPLQGTIQKVRRFNVTWTNE